MSRYKDGVPIPTNLFEAAAWHWSIKVHCSRCRRTGIFEPGGLWWQFERKHWDMRLAEARERFWCRRCTEATGNKIRPSFLEPTAEMPIIMLPMPPDLEWKRAVRRFR